MTGQYQHTIDAKGRLFIPAKLREELGDVCYVTLSADPCLSVYSVTEWDNFCEFLRSRPSIEARNLRLVFANTAKCEVDAQGRILIPQKLRDFVHLKKNATIIGNRNVAEIWPSDVYDQMETVGLTQQNITVLFSNAGV